MTRLLWSPLDMAGWAPNADVRAFSQAVEGPRADRGEEPRSQPIATATADDGGKVHFDLVPGRVLLLLFGDRSDGADAWVTTMVPWPPPYVG